MEETQPSLDNPQTQLTSFHTDFLEREPDAITVNNNVITPYTEEDEETMEIGQDFHIGPTRDGGYEEEEEETQTTVKWTRGNNLRSL